MGIITGYTIYQLVQDFATIRSMIGWEFVLEYNFGGLMNRIYSMYCPDTVYSKIFPYM